MSRLVFPSLTPRFLFLWEGAEPPIAGNPSPLKRPEGLALGWTKERRLCGRGPNKPRPRPPALSLSLQVCETAVGAEGLAPQPAPGRAWPAPPRGLWGHLSAPLGRPHAAPETRPAAR